MITFQLLIVIVSGITFNKERRDKREVLEQQVYGENNISREKIKQGISVPQGLQLMHNRACKIINKYAESARRHLYAAVL